MLKVNRQNGIIRFLVVAAVLYTAWLLLYYLVIKAHTNWDYLLNYNIASISKQLFAVFGVLTEITVDSDSVLLYLNSGNNRAISIGDECNGFKLFSIFSIFILAFPGRLKMKLWYIPMGLVFIHLANVIRVMALVLINNHYPKFLDFNHLYTFTIFVYSIIFILWYIFAKRTSAGEKKV